MSGASSVEELEQIIRRAGFVDVSVKEKPVSREYEEKWGARAAALPVADEARRGIAPTPDEHEAGGRSANRRCQEEGLSIGEYIMSSTILARKPVGE